MTNRKNNTRRPGFPGESSFIVGRNRMSNFSNATGIGAIDDPPNPKDSGGGGGTIDPPPLGVMPTFPDFTAMTCDQILAAVAEMKSTRDAPSLIAKDPAWVQAYTDAIDKAMAIYTGKGCSLTPPPADGGGGGELNPPALEVVVNPAIIPTNTVLPGVSGVGGGGFGGGGGGSTNKPAATAKKSNLIWWLIGGGIALYLMYGSKKSS